MRQPAQPTFLSKTLLPISSDDDDIDDDSEAPTPTMNFVGKDFDAWEISLTPTLIMIASLEDSDEYCLGLSSQYVAQTLNPQIRAEVHQIINHYYG